MTEARLEQSRLLAGRWEARLQADTAPEVRLSHNGADIGAVTVTAAEQGHWVLSVAIPPETLGDGLQTYVMTSSPEGTVLGNLAVLAGQPLDADLRAEIGLLRGELDLLKRAFRRHCVETGA